MKVVGQAVEKVDKVKDVASDTLHRQTPKKRFRDEDSVLEGWLYRETSVQGLVNRRYGALHSTALVTFRKEDSNSLPTKIWPLEAGCSVSTIVNADFMVRNKGVSTLWAIARGHYTKQSLFSFVVRFPAGTVHYKDPVKLCFQDQETANQWQQALASTLQAFSAEGKPSQEQQNVGYDSIHVDAKGPKAELSAEEPAHDGDDSSIRQAPSLQQLRNIPSLSIKDPWECVGDFGHSHSSLNGQTVKHINGVAVYQEPGTADGKQGAFMVSAVVSASPKEVFVALATLGKQTPLSSDWQLIDRLDPHSRIVRSVYSPDGPARGICAPRETVVQQTWREEEDGTITVLGHSVESPNAPRSNGWSWYSPVRAAIEASGFTIAPLQPRYKHAAASDSCLVSYVLKLDLGGWLSDSSWVGLLLQPWTRHLQDAFLQPLLMSVIALRDQVEQARFTVVPFTNAVARSQGTQDMGPAGAPETTLPVKHASKELQSLSSMKRLASLGHHQSAKQPRQHEPIAEEDEGEPPKEKAEEGGGQGEDFSEALDAMRSESTLDGKYWSCPGAAGLHVRGQNYLHDHKKIAAEEPIFSLASADLVQIGRRPYHIAPLLPCIKNSKAPFNFVLNLMVPGPQKLALAVTWAAEQAPSVPRGGVGKSSAEPKLSRVSSGAGSHNDSDSEAGAAPFDILLARFLAGDGDADDKRRDAILKLIPSVVKGSWVIKQSVGHTPVVLGRKLKTQYHRGPNYFEVDVDIGSSRAANSVVGMVQGATTSLVIDMGVVLEGHSEEELPESLLGSVRFEHLDMKVFKVLSEEPEEGSSEHTTASAKKQQ